MTWSIVARDATSGAFAVAITTKFFAVGALCPHAASGVGALSTQAMVNPMYGPRGLRMLTEGAPAAEAIRRLTEADPGSVIRQVHAIDAKGRTAAHTGTGCIDWCGHRVGEDFSVAGNMLAGPQVVDRSFEAYAAGASLPLPARLLNALDAGQAAGGDKRGKQSAALLIYSTEDYPDYDLRVDDHPEPLAELRRLLDMYEADFAMFREVIPTRANPTGIYDRAKIEEVRARRIGARTPAQPIGRRETVNREPASDTKLLEVRDLRTYFVGEDGTSRAVDGVDFALPRGRTLCLVGESGCGKSVTALTIMGLVPQPPGKIASGEILFDGRDLLKLGRAAMNDLRGNRVAMIFQEPMTSLNPAFTIGDQITEVILRHRKIGQREARERAIEMLRRVRIPAPEQRIDDYPHRLSGGMRQRAMIAMALALDPQLLIADEPTTALDVTIQAQILELLRELRAEFGMSLLLITHDLGVVAEVADEVAVMYAGRIVERTDAATLFRRPAHPYTIGLLASIPKLTVEQDELPVIEGAVPNPLALPPGCRFHPRCPFADDACRAREPALVEIAPGHAVACLKAPLERHVL